jgi:sialidase-1
MRSRLWFPGAGAGLALGLLGATLAAAEPRLEKTDLFEAGKGGHKLYRIPGLVVTARGTVLAYCEARKHTGLDWDDIEILLRRSTDGGKTWSAPYTLPRPAGKLARNPVALANVELARRAPLVREGQIAFNNPVAIADRDGAVHFLYCVDYYRCFYLRSDDDGATFSKPVEITATFGQFRKDYDVRVFATGPAHGIQLKSGRLLVPVWLSTGRGNNAHHPTVVATIYSDDRGKTWRRGDIVANETDPLTDPNETVAVELTDGRVLLNLRNDSKANRRAVAFSPDGATRWTRPVFDEQLKEPICMASLCRLSAKGKQDRDRLLFANPDNLLRRGREGAPGTMRDRKNLTVRLSYDEGKTWPVARVLEPGTSAYSDLAVGPDGTIYCLYERGSIDGKDHFATRALTLARFNLEWLSRGKDSLGSPKK